MKACFTRGLLVLGAGRNALRLSPPLVLSRAQADIAIEILDDKVLGVARSDIIWSSVEGLLGGPSDATRVLAIDVYERAFAVFDLGSATALALVMFAGNILLVLAYVRLSRWRA